MTATTPGNFYRQQVMAGYQRRAALQAFARRLLASNEISAGSFSAGGKFASGGDGTPSDDMPPGVLVEAIPRKPADGRGERLLVVLATNTIGGAEIQTRILLQGLLGSFSITLLTHQPLVPFFAQLAHPAPGEKGLTLVTFESQGLVNPFLYRRDNMLAYARAITVTARDSRAALVFGVMHNASLFVALAGWRHYRTLRHLGLVGSLHGSLTGYFLQRGAGPSLAEQFLIRLTVKTCDALITPSSGLAEELISRFGARREQVSSIYNGLDLVHIRGLGGKLPPLAKTCPWILTCCRLADQKDFKTLIEAFARVDFTPAPLLVVVGEGPMAPQILAWASELGVGERVYLAGFQSNPYAWIRQADIFVLSSHYEGFGMVIVEAMALGVPVVASDCPWGPGEIIEPDRSGALFPLGDDMALAKILNHWLRDPEERARLAYGGLARAACFSSSRMVDAYARLFRGLLGVETQGQDPSFRTPSASGDDRLGVLIFHPANVFGGAERTMVNLLTHLPRHRVRVVLVGMQEVFRSPPADAFYDLQGNGLDPGGFSTLRRTLDETRRILAIARKEQCQVIMGMLHYGAIVAGLARPVSGWRVKTIASPRTPSVAGIRFHVGERGKAARLWHNLIKGFCHLASRIIVASSGLKEECVQVFGARAAKVRVIPNCVDDAVLALAQRQPAKLRDQARPDEPWLILTAGRLVAEKDIGTLLKAFALLRKRWDARLDILGSGPELGTLQDLAATLGIAADVRFLGFSPQPLDEMQRADIFVHTGLFEGFGNALLEAMASGVPLVATDCDFGPREIIIPGVNGLLVPVGDAECLAKAMDELLRDPRKRESLVANALRDVQKYSAGLLAQRYEAVFLELGAGFRRSAC